MLLLEVIQGLAAGRTFELSSEVVHIGRAPGNDVVLDDAHVSGEHARVVVQPGHVVLTDLRSTNGTTLVRLGERRRLSGAESSVELESGDILELGMGDELVSLRVTIADDADLSHIVSMRRLDEVEPAAAKLERDPGVLTALYGAQKRIGAESDLDRVLIEVCRRRARPRPQATHVTIVLRDDDQGQGESAQAFVPVMTRVRLPSGESGPPKGPGAHHPERVSPVVIRERAAVLAADATSDVGQTESIMGASIRSTIGVPLWKGEDIIGVLQADNRSAPGMLNAVTSSCSWCSPPTPRSPSPTRA
jgi:GAF domain-containing protein